MGNSRRVLRLWAIAVGAALSLTACTDQAPDRQDPLPDSRPDSSRTTARADEPQERLDGRLASMTDLQGRPLYVLPEAEVQDRLQTLVEPPTFDRVYAPTQCAPDTDTDSPPPAGLEAVGGRSNLSKDQSRLRVWIYTSPSEAELVEYFVGSGPPVPVGCEDVSVTMNGITEHFSYTRADTPPIAPHATTTRYSVTQDGAATHYLTVTAVNGTVAASLTLSTVDPADQSAVDAVYDLAQQAIR